MISRKFPLRPQICPEGTPRSKKMKSASHHHHVLGVAGGRRNRGEAAPRGGAGVPSFVMDHQVIICNFFSDWKLLLEFMAMGGWYADIKRLSGDSCFLFILKVNKVLSPTWSHETSTGLQICILASLASQLGISILVLLQHNPILTSRY